MSSYDEVVGLLSDRFPEVGGLEFYKYIFPHNENQGELNYDYSKPNAIYLYQDERDIDSKRRLRRRIMLNDTWESDYEKYVKDNGMTLCSGLTYRKRANKLENAQRMNALIIDLDGVGIGEMRNLLLRFGNKPEWMRTLPMPTFVIASGRGIHVYYVFEKPIDLYPNIKLQLKALKYSLTSTLWDYKGTTTHDNIQYQGINQGFRMVGSINQKYGNRIRAFYTGDRVDVEYLNEYVRDSRNKVDLQKPFSPSTMTREQAKESYPEWYQRVVVEKKKNVKKWDIKSKQGYALYDWWKEKANTIDVKGGHRYYYLMCLAIYACKCDVPKSKLKKDMYEVFEVIKHIDHENPLTHEDVESALETYDKEYYNFTIADIEKLSNIRIDKNKRNYRNQKIHLQIARATRDVLNPDGWQNKKGSPSKESLVREWQKMNPDGRKIDCERETGLSRPTVLKWWNRGEK